MRPRLAATVAGVAVLLIVGIGVAVASGSGGDASGARGSGSVVAAGARPLAAQPLVLVSGRDDHGEATSANVALYTAAGSRRPLGQVRDGTLARVVAVEGTWLEVRTVEGPPLQGWVDDYYLRRVIHLVGPAPTCGVSLDGSPRPAGEQAVVLEVKEGRARVALVRTPTIGWVSRAVVRELPPREGCGAAPNASGGAPH